MNRMKLLGAAGLAASLMGVPAFAATPASPAPANPGPPASATAAPATPPAPSATAPANNTAMNETTTGGTGIYAHVGNGGYTADQAFVHNGNGKTVANNANDANMRPSQRNPLLADNGSARASKVIGTTVYNTDNQKLGSVDDILLGKNGTFAVISTNQKKVTVPFNSLKLGDSRNEGNDKLVLPNETQAKLNTQLEFHYDASNYQSWKAAHNNNNVNVNNNDRNANLNGNGTGILGNNHNNPKNPG